MPIYEYACNSCKRTLDALQKISDPPLTDCPACGESSLRRLLSAPSFRLKGQGWYETDFKRDRQRNLHGERDESKTDDKKSDGKKPAETSSPAKSTDKSTAKADKQEKTA